MIKEGKFGYNEAISLMVITTSLRVFFTSAGQVVVMVGAAGWYMTIISALVAAFGFMFLYLLLKRFPQNNLMQINDIVLGKFLGSVISLALAAYLMIVLSINLREFIEVFKIYVSTESPSSYNMIVFLICVMILSFLGLEAIARYSKFIIYILGFGFVLVICLSAKNFRLNNMFPILGYGLGKTLMTGAMRSSFYGDIVILGVIALSLHGPKAIKRIGFSSIFISCAIVSISLLSFSLVFNNNIAQELISPMYTMASLLDYGGFFQRIEPVFLLLWDLGSFVEISILFYASLMIYSHVFKIKDRKPLIFPFSIIAFCINLIPDSISDIVTGWVQIFRTWGWTLYFLPWIIVLAIAAIRKKKGASQGA